jgi:hypothetical protein
MDAITLIVTALAAGASAGTISALQDDVKDAVRDACTKLRGLAGKRVAGYPGAELALAKHEADPQTWQALLAAELAPAGAADDAELVAAAKVVMDLIDQAGVHVNKYNVTVSGSKGVQIGDSNVQFNSFND